MIDGLTNSGSIATLERVVQFAGARHRLITNNIANLSTPGFRPMDVSVRDFQEAMRRAIEARRAGAGGRGELRVEETDEVRFVGGSLELHPSPAADNLLFHDGNDRSVERLIQGMVENFMVYRQASELLRNRFSMLNTAIRERL